MTRINLLSMLAVVILLTSCANNENQAATDNNIKVGVFSGGGSGSFIGLIEVSEALKIDKEITPCEVTSEEIMQGKLNELDVLIFPGGSGSTEFNNLGQQAAEKVRKFAYEDGKGLIGICAGGFILSTTPGYPSLQIFPEPDIRDGYYDRGRGLVAFHLNEKGKEIFYELAKEDSLYIQYYDGPIFKYPESDRADILASFYSDVANKPGYPEGTTPGKLIFATSEYGKGKVFISVGHPEATAGMRWIIPRMARWVSGNELVTYSDKLIRPGLNHKEVLYFSEQIKSEKKNFWKLFSEDDSIVINALDELYSIRSRPSIRWSIGLLRHESPEVRMHAAKYLLETEYTDAIPDMQAAVEQEEDQEQKAEMEKILIGLKKIVNQPAK